jgi:hypothetical protein
MIVKVCRLVDGSTVVGNLTDEYLLDAVGISLEPTEEQLIVHLHPIMYPLNMVFTGLDVPRNRILCVLNNTPVDVIEEYQSVIKGVDEPELVKPKAKLTRIK